MKDQDILYADGRPWKGERLRDGNGDAGGTGINLPCWFSAMERRCSKQPGQIP
jgi:hypothetical protein